MKRFIAESFQSQDNFFSGKKCTLASEKRCEGKPVTIWRHRDANQLKKARPRDNLFASQRSCRVVLNFLLSYTGFAENLPSFVSLARTMENACSFVYSFQWMNRRSGEGNDQRWRYFRSHAQKHTKNDSPILFSVASSWKQCLFRQKFFNSSNRNSAQASSKYRLQQKWNNFSYSLKTE